MAVWLLFKEILPFINYHDLRPERWQNTWFYRTPAVRWDGVVIRHTRWWVEGDSDIKMQMQGKNEEG